jgi:hypothetical protein
MDLPPQYEQNWLSSATIFWHCGFKQIATCFPFLNSTIGDDSALVDFLCAKIVQPKDSSRPKSYAHSDGGYLFLNPVLDDTAIASQ